LIKCSFFGAVLNCSNCTNGTNGTTNGTNGQKMALND
jgi:hypothetical protein